MQSSDAPSPPPQPDASTSPDGLASHSMRRSMRSSMGSSMASAASSVGSSAAAPPTGTSGLFFAPFAGVVLIPQSLHPSDVLRLPLANDGDTLAIGRLVEKRAAAMADGTISRKQKVVMDPAQGVIMFRSKVISRHHCKVFRANKRYWLQDTRSSSGTFVNGRRLSGIGEESAPFEIFDGDLLQLGEDYDQNGVVHECLRFKLVISPDLTNPIHARAGTAPATASAPAVTDDEGVHAGGNHEMHDATSGDPARMHAEVEAEFRTVWASLASDAPSTVLRQVQAGFMLSAASLAPPTPLSAPPSATTDLTIAHGLSPVIGAGASATTLAEQSANQPPAALAASIATIDWPSPVVRDRVAHLAETRDPRLLAVHAAVAAWHLKAFRDAAVRLVGGGGGGVTLAT
ncbi:hypothetical protein H9P43_008780 [Blastocladiella emersonii ATCC 22665]|nr:hypothetical protein H9P43_008780 [Blastocladiella emersonii ATCC 22665]